MSATPTFAPTAGVELVVACRALEEFRALGDHVADASAALTEDYATWQPLASALLTQMQRFLDATESMSAGGRYGTWYVSALRIAASIADAIRAWDDGMSNDDTSAILRGNDAMVAATSEIDVMNEAASVWESECP